MLPFTSVNIGLAAKFWPFHFQSGSSRPLPLPESECRSLTLTSKAHHSLTPGCSHPLMSSHGPCPPPPPCTLSLTELGLHSTRTVPYALWARALWWRLFHFFAFLHPPHHARLRLIIVFVLLSWEKDEAARKTESAFLTFLHLFPKSIPQRGDRS